MKIADREVTECFATAETMIDTINPHTDLSCCQNENLEQIRTRYPGAERMTIDAFCIQKAKRQRSPISWKKISGKRYTEMLEVLPPEYMVSNGFLVGEPMDHDAGNGQPRFEAFRTHGGICYQSSRPMTRKEFIDAAHQVMTEDRSKQVGQCYTCKHQRPNAWGQLVCMMEILKGNNATPDVCRAMLNMTNCKKYLINE